MRILRIMKQWKKECGMSRVIQWRYRDGILTIYTSQPGILIGKAGVTVNKYRDIFNENLLDFKELNFVETEFYWA